MSLCHQCQRDPDEYDRALRKQGTEIETLRADLDIAEVAKSKYIKTLTADRDEWRTQHENAIESWKVDVEHLSAGVEAGKRAARTCREVTDALLAMEKERDALKLDIARILGDESVEATIQDRNKLRIALINCVVAMRLWGAEEDGIPQDGPIGLAYDQANELLREKP